ncbi:MAG TPA: Uma2 family endonuclease [Tepidisphaeraceae bacterium]|nr:Uma2 family endonuclease [Tepidisphaeraceae bacterium]
MSIITSKSITADELFAMGDIGRCELIYGELVMMGPAGAEHGVVAGRIFHAISQFVVDHDLGLTFAAETGFKLDNDPDLVRAPDVSYVRKDRVVGGVPKTYFLGAPDLAVEVLSPGDTRRAVAEKVNAWLAYGALSVWVADSSKMTIDVHHTGDEKITFSVNQSISDDRVLPGFSLPLKKIFQLP